MSKMAAGLRPNLMLARRSITPGNREWQRAQKVCPLRLRLCGLFPRLLVFCAQPAIFGALHFRSQVCWAAIFLSGLGSTA